jgi:RNA polymerase sigma factor (sigma-70 family)
MDRTYSDDVLAAQMAAERPRLVRLCSYLTSGAPAAEDLAQEALLIGWRQRGQLVDHTGAGAWLSAIARNLCRHWRRGAQRAAPYFVDSTLSDDLADGNPAGIADPCDLEVELERDELATLLDRAMALLPGETRDALVQHYLEALPQAELAARFGVSEGTLAVRLHRGKLALRRVLTEHFPEEAASYGLVTPESDGWQETRLWCPSCGSQRFLGRFGRNTPELKLRCSTCDGPHGAQISATGLPFLERAATFRPALTRVLSWIHAYYIERAQDGAVPCLSCGRMLRLRIGAPPGNPGLSSTIYAWCDHCQAGPGHECWYSLAWCLPVVQRFWRENPRMRMAQREIESGGLPAVLVGFESIAGTARIEVAISRPTFSILNVDSIHTNI